MHISKFKPGQVITRTKPSNRFDSGIRDHSYIGEPLIYGGILNGKIQLKQSIESNHIVSLYEGMWSDDWELWEDPKALFSKFKHIIYTH